jgi:hypothetical protein
MNLHIYMYMYIGTRGFTDNEEQDPKSMKMDAKEMEQLLRVYI